MQDNIGRAQDAFESRRQREAEDSLEDQDFDYEDWSDEDELYGCDETEA